MKKFLFIFSVVLPLLFLSSCSKNDSLSPSSPDVKSSGGKLLLKIDKTNAPADVQSVFASLSRTGFDSLYKSMNLRTDSTADICFSSITIGTWHLKVDAKSAAGTVLYTGECDVTVSEGVTTQVNLTLNPVVLGVGNIQINVSWGSGSRWIDYAQNPVFTSSGSPTNPYGGVSVGRLLYDNGKYKMWFTNTYEGGRGDIGYVESPDGINWNMVTQNSVLLPGKYGSWDDNAVTTGAVIKDDNDYKLYYTGYSNATGLCNIGMAVSYDGLHWEKSPDPVLTASTSEYKIGASDIVKKNGTYYLYYNTLNSSSTERGMGVATSTDGKHWTKYQNTPLLGSAQAWEGGSVYCPSVILDNGTFKLYYMNFTATGFGEATSNDGLHWTKNSSNPVFRTQDVSKGWAGKVYSPFCIKVGNQYKLFYSGYLYNEFRIGFAVK